MTKIQSKRHQRTLRVRRKLKAVAGDRPRLSIFRSNQHIWSQIIDDRQGVTLVAASSKNLKDFKGTKTQQASAVGKLLAEKALAKKIKRIYFDRGGYRFHGRIKALAEAARKAGLEF